MSDRYGYGSGRGGGKGFGTGQGRGGGRGMGQGMGQGGGGGRGMGQGMGQGRGGGVGMGRGMGQAAVYSPYPDTRAGKEELRELQAQAAAVADKLRAINQRISEVEPTGVPPSAAKDGGRDGALKEGKKKLGVTAVVDEERCVCCGLCIDYCPQQAITLNDTIRIDSSRCDGCGSCIDECPNEAISFKA